MFFTMRIGCEYRYKDIFSFLAKIQKYTALEEGEVYTMARDGVHGALDTVDSVHRFGPIKNVVKKCNDMVYLFVYVFII